MALNPKLVQACLDLRTEAAVADAASHEARDRYHAGIARLYAAGGTMRDIADALDMSHQRVHQILKGDFMLVCSFCGKAQPEVDKLIAGPGVYICDRCAFTVAELEAASPKVKCSFCSKRTDDVEELWAGPGVNICNECVGLVREIIDEDLSR